MAFVLQTFLVTRQREEGPIWKKKRVHMLCRRDATMFFPREFEEEVRSFFIFGLFGCCVLVGKACDQNQRPMEGEVEFKQLWARLGMKRKLRSAPLTLIAKPNLLATYLYDIPGFSLE